MRSPAIGAQKTQLHHPLVSIMLVPCSLLRGVCFICCWAPVRVSIQQLSGIEHQPPRLQAVVRLLDALRIDCSCTSGSKAGLQASRRLWRTHTSAGYSAAEHLSANCPAQCPAGCFECAAGWHIVRGDRLQAVGGRTGVDYV